MNQSITIVTLASIIFITTLCLGTISLYLGQEAVAMSDSIEKIERDTYRLSLYCESSSSCQNLSDNERLIERLEGEREARMHASKRIMFAAIMVPIFGIFGCWLLASCWRRPENI